LASYRQGGFTVNPEDDEFGLSACTIAPPSITATGTDYVTVTEVSFKSEILSSWFSALTRFVQIIAQTLSAGWNQQVLNALSTAPNLSAAPSTTAPTSTPTLVSSLSPVSTTSTPHSTSTHSAGTLVQPASSTSAGIGARARVGGLQSLALLISYGRYC
jgi:hypothetical protein